LNFYYLITSILGLFLWQQKSQQKISKTTKQDLFIVLGIVLSSFVVLYLLLNQFTDSSVPYLDAIVSAFAWAGTWLLLKRKLENWILLNISNLIAIPLQFYKGLELTSLLTIIYVVIAFLGYSEWKKKLEVN
jgi:nicotinamide mononucleotide transporter